MERRSSGGSSVGTFSQHDCYILMTIEVTLSDILACRANRFKKGFYHCPIELATQRVVKQEVWCVGVEGVYLPADGRMFSLPPEAQQFAEDYEGGVKVEPFEFTLGDSY